MHLKSHPQPSGQAKIINILSAQVFDFDDDEQLILTVGNRVNVLGKEDFLSLTYLR